MTETENQERIVQSMMKKALNIFVCSVIATVFLSFNTEKVWADSFTMADIAMSEYLAGEREDPMGSDRIKYNEWYYGYPVGNTDLQNDSAEIYRWDAVFVCWCADQLGFIGRDCFPASNSADEIFQWFSLRGYQLYGPESLISSTGAANIRPGDIIFLPAEDSTSITVGIITAAESSMVSCIVGDVCGTIQLCQLDMAQTSENVAIFPVIPSESNNYMEIAEFLTDKMSLSPAAVCGIIANIIYESNGLPNILGDNGTSYGICQWHEERWQDLINYCNAAGLDWETIEGQLMFLWYELDSRFIELKNLLISCPTSPEGAYQAGYSFCQAYEAPDDPTTKAEIRGFEAMYNLYPLWYD